MSVFNQYGGCMLTPSVSLSIRPLDHTGTRPWLSEDQNRAARSSPAAAVVFYKRERDGQDEPSGIHRVVR
ncbi:hypothetical protein [Paraburkholderia aromaticivorans]|uniref:hypothetical protein n=1 Tax=Paraburkholderia aromaticivorans TaxID=2026199 RepID=UPI0012FE4E0A|nr:hypothetical protein [Paraburkholderia aromaticivorans]